MPDTLLCVECGGVNHRLTVAPELGWVAGDVVVYRCADCQDRFDIVVTEADLEAGEPDAG